MRFAAILLVTLCVTSVIAETSEAKLKSLLAMQQQAKDAVDSARQVIQDLKNKNVADQNQADEQHARAEERMAKEIADYTTVADANKKSGDEATAHRKHIENEIEVTNQYLQWINKRRQDINTRRENLREQRCYGVQMFIKALKEHDEALKVVKLLREDVAGVIKEHGGKVNFAQIKDISDKLSAYSHLFNEQAMKEFAQLTGDDHAAQAVDARSGQYNEKARDNDKGALALESGPAGTDDRDVGQKFIDLIDKLEQHLKDSIKDMEKNEIQASWDLATWLQDSQAELNHLDSEEERKKIYIDKLLIAIVAAKAHEDKAWEIYFKSASVLNDAIEDRKSVRARYEAEKKRRSEENVLLDEVLKMYDDGVATMNKTTRGLMEGQRTETRAGAVHAASAGKVADQVRSAAN